jgi:hypothetical protein
MKRASRIGKSFSDFELIPGDIIKTRNGRLVLMFNRCKRRNAGRKLYGAHEVDIPKMFKNPMDTKIARFCWITTKVNHRKNREFLWRSTPLDKKYTVVGVAPSSTVLKLIDIHARMEKSISETSAANLDSLNTRWDSTKTHKKVVYGRKLEFVGGETIETMKGETVGAGDKVMVKFSNGNFLMVLGNENGLVVDFKSGRFYCRRRGRLVQNPRSERSIRTMVVQNVCK